MIYNSTKMYIDIYNKHPHYDEYFYTELEMPGSDIDIYDALQRVRAFGGEQLQINISHCQKFPEIVGVAIDGVSISGLNVFSNRIDKMDENELLILRGVFKHRFDEGIYRNGIRMRELINLTYGLNQVPSLLGIGDVKSYGEFIIDNDLNDNIAKIHDEFVLDMIDREALGLEQMQIDGGVFVDGNYIAAGVYDMTEEYQGEFKNDSEYLKTAHAFELEIAKSPSDDNSTEKTGEWITLPISKESANAIAKAHGEKSIEDCVYYGFKSAIPSISSYEFSDMKDFDTLNEIAGKFVNMSLNEQVKYKAALQSEYISNLNQALEVAESVSLYDFYPYAETDDQFYREYLRRNSDVKLDSRWLSGVCSNESENWVNAVGGKTTEYGIISQKGGNLFEPVEYHKPLHPIMRDRDFDVVEMGGQLALYVDARIDSSELPDGLFKYNFRHDEDNYYSTLERNVLVNNSGTLITRKPIDLGEHGYLVLDEDSTPNFIGNQATLEDFIDNDFDERFSVNNGEVSL